VSATAEPELSVVVASYERRELLRRCLEALCAQDGGPARFEVIVACDGSTDGSAEMAEALPAPFRLRVLRLSNRGQAAAQDAAVAAAEGEVVVLLDDDVVASPGLVAGHLAAHRDEAGRVGIGALTQRPPAAEDWYAQAFARSWNAHYAALAERPARWTDCFGGNLSFRRREIEAIGGVPTAAADAFDFELALKLCGRGGVPVFLPEAHGVHDDQKGWRRMLSDARRQGAAYVELCRRFPDVWDDLLLWQAATSGRELALRRLFIGLRLPVAGLVRLGGLLPGERRRDVMQQVIRRTALWQGARGRLDRAQWRQLTRGGEGRVR
jgi:glycosyltransferase involved in cell wall biosynthesis